MRAIDCEPGLSVDQGAASNRDQLLRVQVIDPTGKTARFPVVVVGRPFRAEPGQSPTLVHSMHTFGASAPLKELDRRFCFEPETVIAAAKSLLAER